MSNEKKIAVLEFSGVLMPDYFSDYIDGMIGYHTSLSIKAKINSLLQDNDSVIVELGAMYGGAAYEMLALVSYFSTLKKQGKVEGYVSGIAASAGAVLATVLKAKVSKYAQVMYHGVQFSASGSVQEVQADVNHATQLNNTIASILVDYAGISQEKANELTASDNFLVAKEASDLGLVGQISEMPTILTTNKKVQNNMFGLNLNSAADLLNMKNQLEALTANAVDAANAKKDEEWSSKVNALQAKLDGISAEHSTAMANAIEAKTQEFELQVNNLTTENEGLKNQITALQNQISKLENKPDNTGSPNGGDDLSGGKDEGHESLSELRNYYSKKLKNRS